MVNMQMIIAALIGYLLGCLQTSYILGRILFKIDIREHGTSNAGASNATHIMGWKLGVLTAVVDIVKAAAAVMILKWLYPGVEALPFISGAFAVFGHVFPAFMGFRGGKGLASVIGMMLVFDLRVGVLLAVMLVVTTIIFDYIVVGSLLVYIAIPVVSYVLHYPPECTLIGLVMAVISFYKHRVNFRRIISHEEVGLRGAFKKKRSDK